MLENKVETPSTMQADDVEAVLCKEAQFFNSDMTFSNRDLCCEEVKNNPTLDDMLAAADNATKYDGINLEDDIEKVELTSHESSEENEENLSNFDAQKSVTDHPLFSEIPTQNPTESIKSWLQRITDMQNEIHRKYNTPFNGSPTPPLSALPTIPPVLSTCSNALPSNPSRVVKFQDLPYMGEMTLDNSKPRRGRKPKKADICHLIYKNYGTIFPGTPNPGHYLEKDSNVLRKSAVLDNKNVSDGVNKTDVQNRIISSLLEKRLTQEYKKTKETKKNLSKEKTDQNEPLNLCIRDLNHLKIRLLKNTDNTYTSEIKSEPHSDDDVELVQDLPSPVTPKMLESRFPSITPDSGSIPSPDSSKTTDGSTAPGGYVYWPNAGVFIHPVALQQQLLMYQRLAANNSYTLPSSHSPKPPLFDNNGKIEANNQELRKIVPKVIKSKTASPRENLEETEHRISPAQDMKKRNAPPLESNKTPTKRKRSAIFIPPIPTENNTNPATEVSICKFKFTGGAKPTLQEKKMLSVDSGGNFRYYSGTGDKSMRGYEFFPRETLQQQFHNSHGSSTGAFLQASGEKIYPTPPVDFTGAKTSSEFLLTPDLPVPNFSKSHPPPDLASQRLKKRKSRKSLQREKLEQTFKEKGFLIQTQQTESAEGATYCKFRQLRKFTRYLFRSWKDYLPGNIAEGDQTREGKSENELVLSELSRDNIDNLSVHSSELSASNAQQ